MKLSSAYLLVYNAAMCAGWGTILVKIAAHLAKGGSFDTVYPEISDILVVAQTGAVMEIFHAMIGIVRSPVVTTFLQVFSRLLVLYGAVQIGDQPGRTSPIFTQMVVAWSLSEIIRYSFYALNLLGRKPALLTWMRYSAFMILYPVGITGEIGCLYNALPYIKEHKPLTVEMPNKYNFTFSWYNFVWFTLIAVYPFGSYVMYSYMLSQRRKVLSRAVQAVKTTKTA